MGAVRRCSAQTFHGTNDRNKPVVSCIQVREKPYRREERGLSAPRDRQPVHPLGEELARLMGS